MEHETEIMIDAPAAAVWLHLIDFERHDEWSTTFAVPALWPLLVRALGSTYDRFNRELKQRVESAKGRG